jgi:hypothetical protein
VTRAKFAVLALIAPALVSHTAHAQDEFEIQVYDVETAPRNEPGIEVHLNEHLMSGAADQTHLTFEPHYGLRGWLELGGYFQRSLDTTGDLDFAGVKLRAKLRWPERLWCERIGLAVNFELSDVPPQFEPNQWGSEIRPIAELRESWLYAAVNPILSTDLAGRLAGRPQFEPAAKLSAIVRDDLTIGAQAYGAFGPVDSLGEEDVERLYAVVDVSGSWWDLNVGVGAARGNGDHPVGKLIFGAHPRPPPKPHNR